MKKFFLVLLTILSVVQTKAEIKFAFTPGSINSSALKIKMENNLSTLLTEIHNAGTTGRGLCLTAVNMEDMESKFIANR